MPVTVNHLFDEALSLTDAGRIALAERLIESVAMDDRLLQQQLDTASRRATEMETGQVTGIPGEAALKQVRRAVLNQSGR